jgi:hypothetical protein
MNTCYPVEIIRYSYCYIYGNISPCNNMYFVSGSSHARQE